MMPDYIQYGFAGFAFILVGVIVWLIQKLLEVHAQTQAIVRENTAVITRLHEQLNRIDESIKQVMDAITTHHAFLVEHVGYVKKKGD